MFTPPTDKSVWMKFDWEAISSIAWVDDTIDQEFADYARKQGVRVIKFGRKYDCRIGMVFPFSV